ncbi:MAG: ABC transporter ATP-binding protein [Hyphomicrobiales bacterium]
MNKAAIIDVSADVPNDASGDVNDPILEVKDLVIAARSGSELVPLVDSLSFSLNRGETLCIAGESGSGKSMTSLAIIGLLPKPAVRVTKGEIIFQNGDLAQASERQLRAVRGNRIAMIFQEPMTSLNPVLTIGRQLIEAIQAHTSLGNNEARIKATDALKSVRIPQPEQRLKQHPHELSGGMRQRVMIAMALALEPDILIADEPTTALDVTVQGEVLELLRDLQKTHGTSIILITHDMGVVAAMADRVVIMQKGRLVEHGDVADIFADPSHGYTKQLLAAVPRLGDGMRKAAQHSNESKDKKTLLEVNDLGVQFDIKGGFFGKTTHHVHAVSGVSFEINEGETFSLVGESGCGKSTIAKALTGLVPSSGNVHLRRAGSSVVTQDSANSRHRDIQMIFQDPYASLDPRMRVGDLVSEPMLIHKIGTVEERKARTAELFERVGLQTSQMENYPHEFSGGQRQRICIARALALRPKLIIADESVAALDVSVQARVLALLKELQQEFGIAYLFISHDMAVVENISDRVAVMYMGQIVEMGSRNQVFSSPQHPYTKRLISAVPIPDPTRRRLEFSRLSDEIKSPVYNVGEKPKHVALQSLGNGHFVSIDGFNGGSQHVAA